MLILALDTSTLAGSLAFLRDTHVLGEVSTRTDETYSSRMFRHVDFLLRELSLDLREVDLFAVSAGPGSFTGLRVGLSAVKGWAEVYCKPIAAVSALEAVAAQAKGGRGPDSPPGEDVLLAPVIDARRGQIYAGLYLRRADALAHHGDDLVMAPGEFLEFLTVQGIQAPVHFVSPTPEILVKPLAQSSFRGQPVEQVSSVLAPVIGQLGYARAQRGEVVDALSLDANYVRRSDAELLWKGP